MKAYDIVGYAYCAEILCPDHTRDSLIAEGKLSPGAWGMNAQDAIEQALEANGFDPADETQWDSDDMPKVVFADQVTDTDYCAGCAYAGHDARLI